MSHPYQILAKSQNCEQDKCVVVVFYANNVGVDLLCSYRLLKQNLVPELGFHYYKNPKYVLVLDLGEGQKIEVTVNKDLKK